MYARYLTFNTKSGVRSEVEALADHAFELMKSLPGFISVHFLVSENDTDYGAFSLWESKQYAESAGELLRSKTKEAMEKVVVEPPVQQVFEVYKPKS